MSAKKEKTSFIKSAYRKAIDWLYNHKLLALFLAHGGFHIVLFLFCLYSSYRIYERIQTYNQRELRQFSMRIEGDTLNNYYLSHVSIHHTKASPNKKDVTHYVEGIMYHFKYGKRIDSIAKLNTFILNEKPYEGKLVDAIQRMTLIFDDLTFFENVPSNKRGIRKPEDITAHKTGKYGADLYYGMRKSEHYCAFTEDDNIKEDDIQFQGPNITNNWEGSNPYFACFYGFHAKPGTYDLDSTSLLMITYNKYSYKESTYWNGSEDDFFTESPMMIERILPKPTELTVQNVIYRGKDIEKVFEQGGVYITAYDPVRKEEADKMIFALTVLIGIILAFALDIFVQLIIKWRKLKE